MKRPWLRPSIRVGCQVRIHKAVPGFGEALDRYADVIAENPGHLLFKVRVHGGPAKGQEHWMRLEDLQLVGVT